MDRYCEIKKRLIDIAETDPELMAVIAIGSSVRKSSAADEYSDIDIIIAVEKPEKWLYGDMPSQLGEIKISFVEPTLGGGLERRILFDGSLDVDLIVFTPEQLRQTVINGVAEEVMNRGFLIMYDSMGVSSLVEKHINVGVSHNVMRESEFYNCVQDFWFHVVWASKKLLRGELWTAKMCIDAYLKGILLSIIELNCALTAGVDVWHCGRFIEKWAGNENISRLKGCFAHYEKEDMITALKNTAELFSINAKSAADAAGYAYPIKAEEYAISLINEYFPE